MSGDLAVRFAVIVHAPQVVAIRHGSEGSVERQNLQTMPRKIEIADDLGTKQRDDVGAHRELESRDDFFRAGSSTQHVPAFEHDHFLAGARQICGVHQAVVAAANNDYVVRIGTSHSLSAPSLSL